MLLSCRKKQRDNALIPHTNHSLFTSNLNQNYSGKALLSPLFSQKKLHLAEAFFFAPFRGSLTVEAALVLPVFLFCMIAAMQYCRVLETSVKAAGSLCETGKNLAAAAYLYEYPEDAKGSPGAAVSILSAVWVQKQVMSAVEDTSCIANASTALSSFLQEDELIDLVFTYQIRSPVPLAKLPGNFFLQRACVRAWTGRQGNGKENSSDEGEGGETVYVTVTGSVYHEDPDCTHLKLSIREVDADALDSLRNRSGGKYHPCEKCGDGAAGDCVYITNEGDRYHTTLSCSGLKRTVKEISMEEAEEKLRGCSKCGGG